MNWYTLFMIGAFRNSRLLARKMHECYLEYEDYNNNNNNNNNNILFKYQD